MPVTNEHFTDELCNHIKTLPYNNKALKKQLMGIKIIILNDFL